MLLDRYRSCCVLVTHGDGSVFARCNGVRRSGPLWLKASSRWMAVGNGGDRMEQRGRRNFRPTLPPSPLRQRTAGKARIPSSR